MKISTEMLGYSQTNSGQLTFLFVVGCHWFFSAQVRAAGTSEVVQVLLKVGKTTHQDLPFAFCIGYCHILTQNKIWGSTIEPTSLPTLHK